MSKRPLGEKDYALTLLTAESGKIFCTVKGARGIKSKFAGHIDLLNVCEFDIYKTQNYAFVTECNINNSFTDFGDDLKKFYYACLISKILNRFVTENENSHEIFDLAVETLESIKKFNKEELIYEAFKIKACQILGLMPHIHEIGNIELEHLNENIKKIIYQMHQADYRDIIKIKLNKEQLERLKKTTEKMLEHTF